MIYLFLIFSNQTISFAYVYAYIVVSATVYKTKLLLKHAI